jgi:hypothetical protein
MLDQQIILIDENESIKLIVAVKDTIYQFINLSELKEVGITGK